jgi:uncharacterized membrane protein
MKLTRPIWLTLAAVFFIVAGIFHFLRPEFYAQIVPPYFPAPRVLVLVSGAAEIAGGVGLLIPFLRQAAGSGLIVLLVAVFPANIYMAMHPEQFQTASWILWARLPFQGVFLGWVWIVAIHRPKPKTVSQETPN